MKNWFSLDNISTFAVPKKKTRHFYKNIKSWQRKATEFR
jgi:hypothetical protein